ncbi:MAG: NusG domain II-containing protein [Blautia sp.]|jgi:hypothetical protein
MKKKDGILILAVLILAAAVWAALAFFSPGGKENVRITVDGQLYGEYPLWKDQRIPIGETNICEIKNGRVRMIWANCPDQLCIHQKELDEKGQGSIICLPNKVVIEVTDKAGTDTGNGPDAVAG